MVSRYRVFCLTAFVLLLSMVAAGRSSGQTGDRIVPTTNVLISGYGTVGYGYRPQGDNQNAFTTSFSPVFLFQFQDRILFEAELEFELQEGVTETGLEYAQLDLIVHDNLTLVGGKFLLPFGVFGERLHPTWINKFPSSPPLYGHHIATFGAEPLLPVLSDIGVMARTMFRPGPIQMNVLGYVTQGPIAGDIEEGVVPELEFPSSSSDNNTDKMLGGRLDFALPPCAEVNLSYLNGDYDDQNVLDFTAWNVSAELRQNNFDLRGEYIQTRQEIEELTGFETLRRHGIYTQLAYRWRIWEPVVRWTQIFDGKLNGSLAEEGAWQLAFGLDYWFAPSVVFMAGYELNREDALEIDNDRLLIHVAYGF